MTADRKPAAPAATPLARANDTQATNPPGNRSGDHDQVRSVGKTLQDLHATVLNKPSPTPEDLQRQQDAEAQQEQRRRAREVAGFLAKVGRRFRDCTLDNYDVRHAGQQEVIEALRECAATMPDHVQAGRGIVMMGPVGVGKDHLLVALGRIAVIEHGLGISWWRGMDLYSAFRDSIRRGEVDERLVAELTTPEILILSDPVPPIGEVTEYQAGRLLQVVDRRYAACKSTWATINVAGRSEADERSTSPIIDRLTAGALLCRCFWPSFRKPLRVVNRGEESQPGGQNGPAS